MSRPKGSKNKPKIYARTLPVTTKSVTKEATAPEPETTLCKVVETVAVSKESIMGKCIDCGNHNSHSEIDHLCLNCHKLKEGFVFDDDDKRYIKTKGKKK